MVDKLKDEGTCIKTNKNSSRRFREKSLNITSFLKNGGVTEYDVEKSAVDSFWFDDTGGSSQAS